MTTAIDATNDGWSFDLNALLDLIGILVAVVIGGIQIRLIRQEITRKKLCPLAENFTIDVLLAGSHRANPRG